MVKLFDLIFFICFGLEQIKKTYTPYRFDDGINFFCEDVNSNLGDEDFDEADMGTNFFCEDVNLGLDDEDFGDEDFGTYAGKQGHCCCCCFCCFCDRRGDDERAKNR